MDNSDHFKGAGSEALILATAKQVSRFVFSAILLILLVHAGLMVLKHVYGNSYVGGLAHVFNLDSEGNIPALMASLLIFFCGLAAFANGALRSANKSDKRSWFYFGSLLIFLAVDEGARIHETVGHFVFTRVPSEWLPTSAFMLPYAVLGIVSAIVLFGWYLRLDRKTQALFAVAGTIYLAGAAGVEAMTHAYFEGRGLDMANNNTLIGDMLVTIEETCEFFGMGLLLHSLMIRLGCLRISAGDEQVSVSSVRNLARGLDAVQAG